MHFPAIAIRKSTEKQESIDAGHCIITGFDPSNIVSAVNLAVEDPVDYAKSPIPADYLPLNVSSKVVRIVVGMGKVLRERVWGRIDDGSQVP